jgi:hypothetical protein
MKSKTGSEAHELHADFVIKKGEFLFGEEWASLLNLTSLEAWRVRGYTHRNVGMSTGEDRFAILSFTLSSLTTYLRDT